MILLQHKDVQIHSKIILSESFLIWCFVFGRDIILYEDVFRLADHSVSQHSDDTIIYYKNLDENTKQQQHTACTIFFELNQPIIDYSRFVN